METLEFVINLALSVLVIILTYFGLQFFNSTRSAKTKPAVPSSASASASASSAVAVASLAGDPAPPLLTPSPAPAKPSESSSPTAAPSPISVSSPAPPLFEGNSARVSGAREEFEDEEDDKLQEEELAQLNADLDRKIRDEAESAEERDLARLNEIRKSKGKGKDLSEYVPTKELGEDDDEFPANQLVEDEDEDELDDEDEQELDDEDEEWIKQDFSKYDAPSPDFLNLKNNTRCPFAKNSRVMNGAKWDSNLSLTQNVVNSVPLLEIFNRRVSLGQDLDGFLIEIENLSYGDTIESLSKTVKKVLTVLGENDPTGENAMAEDLRSNFWNYHFGEDYSAYFISVLAPCYHEFHSRFGYGSKHTFILLQPEISFHNKAIKLDYDPKSVRHLVRKRFQDAGQPYDPRDSKEYTMCNWVVRPMGVDLPPVRWWEVSIEGWD